MAILKITAENVEAMETRARELEKTRLKWREDFTPKEMKQYRQELREARRLQTLITEYMVEDQKRRANEVYVRRVAAAKNREFQYLADDLHDIMCKQNHTDRCDYHYGNWNNDVRNTMLDYYDLAKKLVETKGWLTAKAYITKIEQARLLEKDLRDMKETLI